MTHGGMIIYGANTVKNCNVLPSLLLIIEGQDKEGMLLDWFSVQNIANAFGGVLLVIYACWTMFNKVGAEISQMTKKGQEKKKRQQEKEAEQYQQLVKDVSKHLTEEVKTQIDRLEQQIEAIKISSNDILRIKINDIYYRYNRGKKIPRFDKENCAKMVEDYTKQGGNTYVKRMWEEICTWEVVDGRDEVEE